MSKFLTVGPRFEIDGIIYGILPDSTVWVDKGKDETFIDIPETVSYNGTSYLVTMIGNFAFSGCSAMTSIILPASLTSITWGAFSGCSAMTSVILPASLTNINDRAFYGCDGLTSLTLPESLTSIWDGAFCGCKGLTSITLPASLTTIGKGAFSNCRGLTSFIVPSENPAFCVVDGVLFTKDKTELVAYPGGKKGTFYIIPDSVTSIGDKAFEGCYGLTSLVLHESLVSIGKGAFAGCSGLTAFIVSYYNPAFCVMDGVLFTKDKTILIEYPKGRTDTTYVVPNSVKTIGASAFWHCSCLTSVTFPASLTSIGFDAFGQCHQLVNVYCLGTSEPSIDLDAFSEGPADRVLRVPNATSAFTADKWGASDVAYVAGKWKIFICIVFLSFMFSANNPGELNSLSFLILCLAAFFYSARMWKLYGSGK